MYNKKDFLYNLVSLQEEVQPIIYQLRCIQDTFMRHFFFCSRSVHKMYTKSIKKQKMK